jgi:hypothetical protein
MDLRVVGAAYGFDALQVVLSGADGTLQLPRLSAFHGREGFNPFFGINPQVVTEIMPITNIGAGRHRPITLEAKAIGGAGKPILSLYLQGR